MGEVQAGYSGTPLVQKLGIKSGFRLAFLEAPPGFRQVLGTLPEGSEVLQRARAPLDVVVFFTKKRGELEKRFEKLKGYLSPAGSLWVAWPKQESGVATDLTGNVVREIGLAGGLVDTKVCAIDEVWSGLRFVRRVEDR